MKDAIVLELLKEVKELRKEVAELKSQVNTYRPYIVHTTDTWKPPYTTYCSSVDPITIGATMHGGYTI